MADSRARGKRLRWAPSVVFSIGVIVTAGASFFAARTARDMVRARIESERHTAALLVRTRLEHFERLLRSFAELVPALPSRGAGPDLVAVAQDLGFAQHGIARVGWVPLTSPRADARPGTAFTVRLPPPSSNRQGRLEPEPFAVSARDAAAIERSLRLRRPIADAASFGVPATELRIFVPVRTSGSDDVGALAFVEAPVTSFVRDLGGPQIGPPHLTVRGRTRAARSTSDRRFAALGIEWNLAFGEPAPVGTSSPLAFVALSGALVTLLLTFVTWSESRARGRAQAVTLRLRESEEALRRADRAKDDFLAMLGHELRNPLAALSTALKVLRLRMSDDPYTQRSLDVADRQVRHQTRLVDDLLDVSRITLGKVQLDRVRVDLREIARRATLTVQASHDLERRVLVCETRGIPVVVEGDAVRLEQVVSNVLTNAVRHTSPDGHLAVEVTATDTHGVVTVRDDGVGIRREDTESVFRLFTQLDVTVDRTKGGLGVGLAVAKRIVDLHEGEIEAFSEGLGRGSEFTVRIPLAPSDPVAPEAFKPPNGTAARGAEAAATESLRVLVVEDNEDARSMMVELVTLLGHRVDAVSDGRTALEYLERYSPDVALVDLGLPGLDGFELARRAHRSGRHTPRLVAVSGYAQREDQRHARDAGFDVHLAKPVHLEQLENVLRRGEPPVAAPHLAEGGSA